MQLIRKKTLENLYNVQVKTRPYQMSLFLDQAQTTQQQDVTTK